MKLYAFEEIEVVKYHQKWSTAISLTKKDAVSIQGRGCGCSRDDGLDEVLELVVEVEMKEEVVKVNLFGEEKKREKKRNEMNKERYL